MKDELRERGFLSVKVASAQSVFCEGKARSVSSVNLVGPFDVLPKHENFISLIKDKIVVYPEAGKKYELPIAHGLLEVSGDRVQIFVGI